MEYKVGDRVKYDSEICTVTKVIESQGKFKYRVQSDTWFDIVEDEMIEELVEEEGKETSWKPSKEEMDVLYSLAYITNKYDEHKEEVITRLYQDLKREFFNDSSYENMFSNTENDVRRRSTIQVLEYARSLDNYNQYGKADIDKNIAWLEKQGKSALEARTDNELVEEEVGLVDNLSSRWVNEFNLPEGYIFKDENGNEILTNKIILEKKKKEYPKTYEECCKIIYSDPKFYVDTHLYSDTLGALYKLLICRDAYWKIAGEEKGLGKPWEPDFTNDDEERYGIYTAANKVVKDFCGVGDVNTILTFPTAEMRDAFYDNFKEEIEFVKELL